MLFLWLSIYGSAMLLSRYFSFVTQWAIPMGYLVSILTLLIFLPKSQIYAFLNMKWFSVVSFRYHIFFVPFLVPVLIQLTQYGIQSYSCVDLIGIFLAALLEELFFRGYILHLLCRTGILFGSVMSSVLFAAAHFFNVETGSEITYILWQVVYALVTGFSLSGIALSCESLLPCIIIHFLLNITTSDSETISGIPSLLFGISIVGCLIYGIHSIRSLRKNTYTKGHAYEIIH